jgi:hypothetical protein
MSEEICKLIKIQIENNTGTNTITIAKLKNKRLDNTNSHKKCYFED